MANVEAKRGARQYFKDPSQIRGCLSDRLPFVHVLDAEQCIEPGPGGWIVHGVGMNDER
jgi:hypothetical protein